MTPPTTASTDQLRDWLLTGADLAEGRHQRAAVELLDFADLLGRRDVRTHIDTRVITDDGRARHIARVDWTALAAADLGPLGGAQQRLLKLAISIAGGVPVDLRYVTSGELGAAHARAALAAVVRALGLADDVQISDTPDYLERKRAHDEWLSEFENGTGSRA
ncbi:hypothetical protein [Nocardia asteroides]|uniref:hypothetical protein n=1 Tax=Nocardia asteroides TaxID=1824 RepID=UPI001E5D8C15|nr:hypothetical protein [Nocardia asteroides]UGT58799.1 hypothetical protein LTT85_33145 [Nocardia asteroides]